MRVHVASSFIQSLSVLDERSRAAVKMAAFDFLASPVTPGFQLHRVQCARSSTFWSLRVNRDVRIIAARATDGFVLCHADHHDGAYVWAKRHTFDPGAMSFTGDVDIVDAAPGRGLPARTRTDELQEIDEHAPDAHPMRRAPGTAAAITTRRLRARSRAETPVRAPHSPASPGAPAPIAELLRLLRGIGRLSVDGPSGRRPNPVNVDATMSHCRATHGYTHAVVVALALLATAAPAGVALACSYLAGRHTVVIETSVIGALVVALSIAAMYALARRAVVGALTHIEHSVQEVGAGAVGRADVRIGAPTLSGHVLRVDARLQAVTRALRMITDALERLARGDAPDPIRDRLGGDFDRARCAVNAMSVFMRARPEDIRTALDVTPRAGHEPRDTAP